MEPPSVGAARRGRTSHPVVTRRAESARPDGPTAAVFDSLPDAVLVVDEHARVLAANRAAQDLLGLDGDPLVGAPLTDVLGVADSVEDVVAAIATSGSFDGTVALSAGREGCVLEVRCNPLHGGGIGERVLVLRDRTWEAERLTRLEASNNRSLALLDAIPDLLFRISSDMTFLDYRDPTTRGLGLAPEAFLGKRLDEFLPSEVAALVEPNLRQTLATGEAVAYASYYDYGGDLHTFENRVVKSGPDEAVLICRDTTAQTRAVEAMRRSEARLRRIVGDSREFTAILDPHGVVGFISDSVQRVLGYEPSALLDADAFHFVHADDAPGVVDALHAAIADEADGTARAGRHLVRARLRRVDGTWRVLELAMQALLGDPDIGGVLVHCRDISDYAEVEASLRESLQRTESIIETAPDGIVICDEQGRIELMNTSATRMFGRRAVDTIGQPSDVLLSAEAQERLWTTPGVFDSENLPVSLDLMGRRGDGSEFPLTFAVGEVRLGDRRMLTGFAHDMSERHALQRQLQHQATHDGLTGLPNRTLFDVRLADALAVAERDGTALAILFVDIDRFKLLNDGFGHGAGDRVLVAAAERLARVIGDRGTVARFGGDEFLVLGERLHGLADRDALAAEVLDTMAEAFDTGDRHAVLSASIGVVVHQGGVGRPVDPGTLVCNADVALYRAKERGRARYEVFDEEMEIWTRSRLDVEQALRGAVAGDELVAHYQPVLSLRTNRLDGFEALMRWRHDGSLVYPDKFIDIAEETGLIVDLGRWMLETATAQLARWQASPDGAGCASR